MGKVLVIALLAWIPFYWQPLWGQAPGIRVQPGSNQKKESKLSASKSPDAQIGTQASPVIVDIKQHPKTEAEAAEDKRKDDTKEYFDRWTFRLAVISAIISGLLLLIGGGGVYAAVRTLRAIERQAELMEAQATEARDSATQQRQDVQASIAEATRVSGAMEGIAKSMASNVESVRESVGISREIADMQKLATELQSRAYLSVFFNTAIFQDAHHVFEVEAVIRNHGNTPAYDVTFSAASQIVPVPLPEDFAFPLQPDAAGASVSLMAPGTTKLIKRRVSGRVPDDRVESIKRGDPQCLVMWGIVEYRDAFKETRHTRFAFHVNWIPWLVGMDKDKDGNPLPPQIMSYDTARHNDAN